MAENHGDHPETCEDLGVQVLDANGTNLRDSVQGAIGGLTQSVR
jgi:hypothetical protein